MISGEKIEEKAGKIYKRFIGPNSVGMSKNLESAIRKALGVAILQNSKRHERLVMEWMIKRMETMPVDREVLTAMISIKESGIAENL